jgi:penicillin-binding protein 1A
MPIDEKRRKTAKAFVIVAIAIALISGIALGIALAATKNIQNQENFTEIQPALPTKLLDINGNLITEFSSDEKREMVSISEIPRHLIYAVITREDQDFFRHHGFTLRGFFRALWGKVTGRNLGGGSTITQQLAGTLYADRADISIRRKLVELWWAFQLERRLTKNEILEQYLNKMYLGSGTYGVESASKFYFGHSVREITLAESAMLVIQLSNPVIYSPLSHPNAAKLRQREVLNQMVDLGYATKKEADESFSDYWVNFDYTRINTSAYFMRDDKAPWFSEYARRQLEEMLYGNLDLYKDGFVVHTTLNLDYQLKADEYMRKGIIQGNESYRASSGSRLQIADSTYKPIVDMLSLAFNLDTMHGSDSQVRLNALSYYNKRLNTTIDAAAMLFGLDELKQATNSSYTGSKADAERNTVEGALITLENDTGYILALVGGSKYDGSNQYIRATQSQLMPGSSFKPLYYSAAIDSRKFTEASLIYDEPVVFYNENGTPYIPLNYKGEWKGTVLLWQALANSMNVPSLKILDGIGFDAAISRAASLLDIHDPDEITRTFPRVYPLGLGVIGVTPLKMARAFAVFANQGKEVTPLAIRQIEDRNGRIILDPEKELRIQQKKKGSDIQVVSPQNAYIMTDLLQGVIQAGTLAGATGSGTIFTYKDQKGQKYVIPAAGKTGTTQNWADDWTVGFTPYMTTAIWFGFDKAGNSLGVQNTGAIFVGPIWAGYMHDIHENLPPKQFSRPQTGLVEVTVCAKSGLLPTQACNEGLIRRTFLEGTEPTQYCDIHPYKQERDEFLLNRLESKSQQFGGNLKTIKGSDLPSLDLPKPDSAPSPAAQSTGSLLD